MTMILVLCVKDSNFKKKMIIVLYYKMYCNYVRKQGDNKGIVCGNKVSKKYNKKCSKHIPRRKEKYLCIMPYCKITASYGKTIRLYCTLHKIPGMINLTKKLCIIEECDKFAIFGMKKKTHCEQHKKENMRCFKKCNIDRTIKFQMPNSSVTLNMVEKNCKNCCKIFMSLYMSDYCNSCKTQIQNIKNNKYTLIDKIETIDQSRKFVENFKKIIHQSFYNLMCDLYVNKSMSPV